MAKTNAERLKTWREKHKMKDSFKERKKMASKAYYDRKKETDSAATKLKKKEDARLRKQKSRSAALEKRQQSGVSTPKKISPSVMGKAVKKAFSIGLPKSPRTRKEVIKRIGFLEGVELFPAPRPIIRKRIADDMKMKILQFYEEDDVSRVDPGRKTATVTRSSNTSIKARRYLLHNINETYALFADKYPDDTVGRSTFAALRPTNIRPYQNMPHNVCVCKHHENFRFVHEAVQSVIPCFQPSPDEMLASYLCDVSLYECMNSSCQVCQPEILDLFNSPIDDEDQQVQYRQWVMVGKRIEVVTVEHTISDAVTELKNQLNAYMLHVFTKNKSQEHFNVTRKQASPEIAVLQVDFAENFSCQYQDEVQSAHWGNPQVTVFTGVVWHGENALKSYAVVADNITHDRYCVDVFIRKIIEDHIQNFPDTKTLHVFSDGCAAQFKSRFNFSNITLVKRDLGLSEFTWTFFATSHGKGAVDGIGAVVKRHVWNVVRSKKEVVRNAEAFVNACFGVKVHVMYVPSQDISLAEKKLDADWKGIVAIKGTQKLHHIVAGEPYSISWKTYPQQATAVNAILRPPTTDLDTSDMEVDVDCPGTDTVATLIDNGTTCIALSPHPQNRAVGDWVTVVYDEQWLPGIVEEVIAGDQIRVKFMKVFGPNRFIWPVKDDFDTIACDTVLTSLEEVPNLSTYSGRGAIYSLSAKEFQRVLNIFISLY